MLGIRKYIALAIAAIALTVVVMIKPALSGGELVPPAVAHSQKNKSAGAPDSKQQNDQKFPDENAGANDVEPGSVSAGETPAAQPKTNYSIYLRCGRLGQAAQSAHCGEGHQTP